MLHLVDQNKAGRNIVKPKGETLNWRELFKTSEDSLTSSVFSLLFYLPAELLWKILRSACYETSAPPVCGRLLGYEFWPRWESTENNTNENYIEPDLVIFFERFHVIIEAKRYDFDQQYRGQWREEIIAYHNRYGSEQKEIYLVALGGITSGDEGITLLEDIPGAQPVPVFKCRWNRLLKQVRSAQESLNRAQGLLSSSDAVLNILHDLLLAFRIHGFSTGELFETMPLHLKISHSGQELTGKGLRLPFHWQAIPAHLLNLQTPDKKLQTI